MLLCLAGLVFCYLKKDNQNYLDQVTENNSVAPLTSENILPPPPPPPEPEKIRLLFVGDLMLDRHVKTKIQQNGTAYLFSKLLAEQPDFFNHYDLISANLEGAITKDGEHYAPSGENDFAFSPATIAELKNYNFNFFNLANNHLTDQANQGVEETRQNLSDLGFNFSGCPDAKIGDCSSTMVNLNDYKFAMIGFSQVYQSLDETAVTKIISDLSTTTDLQIVNIHWGNEYQHQYNQTQQTLAHAMIDAGADIIIGHHPHVVQGIEIYKNKPIFYSLGNFIFDQYFSADTQIELTVAITLNPITGQAELMLQPLQSAVSQLSLLPADQKTAWLQNLADWSPDAPDYQTPIKQGVINLKLITNLD